MLKRYWGGVVLLLLACGCQHREDTTESSEMNPGTTTVRERLVVLEDEMSSVAMERAYSDRYFRGGKVKGAWVDGDDLFVQVFDSARRIYVMHGVDLKSGRPLWICDLGTEPVRFAPGGGDRYVVFLLDNDGGMMVVNRRTGGYDYRVRTRLGTLPSGSAVASDNSVFLTSLVGGRLVAVSPKNGSRGWALPIEGTPVNSPVMTPRIPRRMVVLASDAGIVRGVPAASWDGGAPGNGASWTYRAQGAISAPLTVAQSMTSKGLNVSVLVPCEDRGLHCVDAQSGQERWIARTAHPFTAQAYAGGGRVFARNGERMMVYSIDTGLSAWPVSKPGEAAYAYEKASHLLAADNQRAYLSMGGAHVLRCDGNTGETQSEGELSSFDWVLTATDANLLIGITKDGYLVAYK